MKPVKILLVEDNEGDILLTQEALEESRVSNILNVAKDGSEAINFLEKKGTFSNELMPDLILLDVNLPKKMDMRCYSLLNQTKSLNIFL